MGSEVALTAAFGGASLRSVRIVVLYATVDTQVGEAMVTFFRAHSAEVWTKQSLLGGQTDVHVKLAFDEADFIFVLISRAGMGTRDAFHRDVRWAAESAELMPEGGVKILPLKLDSEVDLPGVIRHLVPLDAADTSVGARILAAMRREYDRRRKHHDW